MKLKVTTYEQYLTFLKSPAQNLKMHEGAELIIERFKPPKTIPSGYAPVTFLLDYTTKKYMYVAETCFNVLGYTAEYFIETGLEDYLQKWHPADFDIINSKVFPYNFEFLKTLSLEKYGNVVYSYNYRIKNSEGNYITVVQRFSYIPSNVQGIPYGVVGVIFDITHFKNSHSIVHTIEETLLRDNGIVNELIYKKVHPVYEINPSQLSKRELEILKLMAGGLSSKQIAGTLNISKDTVNNHRKKMLEKTGCKNSIEILSYALNHDLL